MQNAQRQLHSISIHRQYYILEKMKESRSRGSKTVPHSPCVLAVSHSGLENKENDENELEDKKSLARQSRPYPLRKASIIFEQDEIDFCENHVKLKRIPRGKFKGYYDDRRLRCSLCRKGKPNNYCHCENFSLVPSALRKGMTEWSLDQEDLNGSLEELRLTSKMLTTENRLYTSALLVSENESTIKRRRWWSRMALAVLRSPVRQGHITRCL